MVVAHKATVPEGAPQDRVFTGHRVTTPVFAGPIDLLIYLVQHDEIDIFAFALRAITADYLAYLDGLSERDIEQVGEFMVMTAQLMEIKSARLLPAPPAEQEEEEEVGDPRAMLLERLMEYKRYRTVAEELRARAEMQRWVFFRAALANGNGEAQPRERKLELSDVSAFDLWAAFQNVLNRVKEKPPQNEIVRPRFTVPQKMAAVASKVKWAKERLRFADLFKDDVTVMEVIVTFLAILELIRLRRIRVVQEGLFGEIWVEAPEQPEEA